MAAKPARQFSSDQLAYVAAKALYNVQHEAYTRYKELMNIEGARLGLEVQYYAILPEGHPMNATAQDLLTKETEAATLMYQAAHNLFDWATETTFARCGTPAQKELIRAMVVKVKAMAFVEGPFEELVDMSMKLAA